MKKDPVEYSYEVYIGAPASRVWKGLIDGDLTQQYVYGTRFEGKLEKGASYGYAGDGGFRVVDGKILEVTREKVLAMTWSAHWDEASGKDRPSRVRYELTAAGPATTKLRVVHDDFDGETPTYKGSVEGWPLLMSSLKTLLETGKPLTVPAQGAS